MRLDGRVAVVTGGGAGIGRGIARTLAGFGARVAIWEKDPETAAAAGDEVDGLGLLVDVREAEQVEAALVAHPAVADCAVFGIPDDEWGEQVKAAVQFEPGTSVADEELIAWCRERLAGYKCPRSVDVHEALPREATGKLKKRYLRDAYWEGRERAV